MLPKSFSYKKYNSAHDRFFKPAIVNFFKKEFPGIFGPIIIENIADELLSIFDEHNRDTNLIKHGQILWNALDKNTRADSPNRKYVTVILTVVNDNDISDLVNKISYTKLKEKIVERIIKEAYQQGGILSMRDIGLILNTSDSNITRIRKRYELNSNNILPHTGNLHDMGSCITHKKQIIYKIVVEKKDPLTVASETNHTIYAVDNYLRDFNRVKTLYDDNKDITFISIVTKLSKNLIKEYIDIINTYVS